MNWLRWWRRRSRDIPTVEEDGSAAREARVRSEQRLEDTLRQQPAIDEATQVIRAQDAFGEQLEKALRRRIA